MLREFQRLDLQTNPILREMVEAARCASPRSFRRAPQPRFATNDAMSAFVQSVDQIMNIADLANFKPVLRRGVAQYQELYKPFQDALKTAQVA